MQAFERRYYGAEDLHQILPGDVTDQPALYAQIIGTYPVLTSSHRLRTEAIIRIMDVVLGRSNTMALVAGNTPIVLMTAGHVIEDQFRLVTVPNKDLQVNLLINILKECAHVEGIPPGAERLAYVQMVLLGIDLPQDLRDRVYGILSQNQSMDVPWLLTEVYDGMASPL